MDFFDMLHPENNIFFFKSTELSYLTRFNCLTRKQWYCVWRRQWTQQRQVSIWLESCSVYLLWPLIAVQIYRRIIKSCKGCTHCFHCSEILNLLHHKLLLLQAELDGLHNLCQRVIRDSLRRNLFCWWRRITNRRRNVFIDGLLAFRKFRIDSVSFFLSREMCKSYLRGFSLSWSIDNASSRCLSISFLFRNSVILRALVETTYWLSHNDNQKQWNSNSQ